MIEATIYVTWDEAGNYAAAMEAEEAADILDANSHGRFRRVATLKLTLPSAEPIELEVDVPAGASVTAKSAD